jgi:hypothetical protein
MTANEYGEVDRQFLTGVAVVISILFIIWMFMLGKGELICISTGQPLLRLMLMLS